MISPAITPDTTQGDTAGRAADAIADALNIRGFDALIPAQQGTSFLQVTNARGALCQMTIYGSGAFGWEYRYRDSGRSDPSVLVAMITCILGGSDAAGTLLPVAHHPRPTLKGQIGKALAGRGMQARLNILDKDESAFEVYAEVTVTNPTLPDRGTVSVADDGLICWRGQIRDPKQPGDGLDLDEITRTLGRVLATATSLTLIPDEDCALTDHAS